MATMGSKQHSFKSHHHSSIRSSTILTIALFLASLAYLFIAFKDFKEPFLWAEETKFSGDLRDANFAWNKLCFGQTNEKLKLAVFSKTWPIGADPGGMERHASTLYTFLAARGHEIHVFTVPSDKWPHENLHEGNLHVYFAPNEYGRLNCTEAFEIFHRESEENGAFDYVHTESVALPHWRTKMVDRVAVTWHGIWYEIMHSKLFQELLDNPRGQHLENPRSQLPGNLPELHEAMPRLIDEIRFFSSYSEHICISDSAGEVLVNIYQLPPRNVHIILNGVDQSKFIYNKKVGEEFRVKHGVPSNATMILGVAGRLVKDKGHPLLHEAFSSIIKRHPGVFLLVAGSGPWGSRYGELEKNVKVLGALDPSELSKFYNALDLFVNPTLRPQGLDLTLMEAMHCGKPVLTPNFPSISRSVVLNEGFGYTFSPNLRSFVEALESAISDGPKVLQKKGMVCRKYAVEMFTATKMALAYERFFLCMKNSRYCQYPLPTDC